MGVPDRRLNRGIELCAVVEQMYSLLKQHQVTVPPEDEVQLDDLHHVQPWGRDWEAERRTSLALEVRRREQLRANKNAAATGGTAEEAMAAYKAKAAAELAYVKQAAAEHEAKELERLRIALTGSAEEMAAMQAEKDRELFAPRVPGVVIVGCTGDSGVGNHDANALEAGQDLVVGKPMPHVDQLGHLLSRV